jgi:hypothetical protein
MWATDSGTATATAAATSAEPACQLGSTAVLSVISQKSKDVQVDPYDSSCKIGVPANPTPTLVLSLPFQR